VRQVSEALPASNGMEVIPSINCHYRDIECVEDKLARARKFLKKGDWLHLDVSDGRFTFNKSWQSPREWAYLRPEFNLEVHLMVEEPEKYINAWIAAGARRFIVHAETISEDAARSIFKMARKRGIEVMLGSNPHTTTIELWPYLKLFSHYQVLAVDPGPAGQKFMPIVVKKIRFLRNFAPNAKIEVDGGITPEVAREVKAAGANTIVSGTYIFGSKNPKKAYKELRKI
jgi:ribulose-phosphate 3-epimerase